MKVETWPIERVLPYENNPRVNADAVDAVVVSIREFGWQQPLVVDSDGVIIVGHTRRLAAMKLGLTEVPVVVANLPPDKARAYRLADNQTATIAEWDFDKLPIELFALEEENFDLSLLGFSAEDLARIMGKQTEDGLTDPDECPEAPQSPVTQPGDLWLLGRHRLLCGDSTQASDVQRLMDGKLADLWLTDPPYGVDYVGKTKDALTIQNDSLSNDAFRSFLVAAFGNAFSVMKPGASFYIFHADSEGYNFRGAVVDCGERVRQCLIWLKNSMVMGRQDYQWVHEPCQPPGTMVRTPNGCVPIESLRDGDRVVSYDSYSGVITGMRDGRAVKVASREYEGKLYGVCVAGRQTWATDSHRFTVRFRPGLKPVYCTYLMRRDDWWRVGFTRTYDARGFGLKQRIRQEKGEEAWIISTHENKLDALCAEQVLSARYGIPQTHWEVDRGFKSRSHASRTPEMINRIYQSLDLDELQVRATALLADHGRRLDMPFTSRATLNRKCSRRITAQIPACNLIPEIMEVPVPYDTWNTNAGKTFDWSPIKAVDVKDYSGPVYSLDIERDHHYIADGIVTHNCLYGWKAGASHHWYSDRKQTTVLHFNRPSRSEIHPTMKPVAMFVYLMLNSSARDGIVLDSFGGSATTLIAAEQTGRQAYLTELDPKYVDVIVQRYQAFSGKPAILERTGDSPILMREREEAMR